MFVYKRLDVIVVKCNIAVDEQVKFFLRIVQTLDALQKLVEKGYGLRDHQG